jgi:tetratricopeptide (TPR) repeat protein
MLSKFRYLSVFVLAFSVPMLVGLVSYDSAMAVSAVAAEEKKEPKYKDVKTRKRASVGKTCAKALDKVQGEKGPITLASDAEENVDVSGLWVDAKTMLSDIDSRAKVCASAYEQTQVWNMLGYVEYSLDNIPGAINYYKKIVNSEGAPPEFKLDTRLTLAQFYAATELYELAIVQYELWAEKAFVIGADQRLTMASIYYQLERKEDALRTVELGIADAEAKGILPKERMWALQRVLYYEKDDLKKVTSILKQLVTHYPKWMYWKNLGGMYGAQEQEMNQLVSYEVVYLNGELTTESDVMSMAYMYLGADVPYTAAKILEKGMSDDIVKRNSKNLDLLGNAWLQAKHLPEALRAFEGASTFSDSGEIQYRIASIYLDLGQDKKAYLASKKAAEKGGVKNPAANYSKMGSALINLHCYKDAVKAFNRSVKAAKTKRAKRFPKQWIKFANYEGDRLQKLRDVGATVPGCSKA